MRLIDADALENDTRKVLKKSYTFSTHTFLALHLMLDIIKDRETIRAEPVKHGKWNLTEKTSEVFPYLCEISCSVCGYGSFATDKQSVADWLKDTKYCSNCGAKMDGGNKND